MDDSSQALPVVAILHIEVPLEEAQFLSAGTLNLARVQDNAPTIRKEFPLYAGAAFRIGREPDANDLTLTGACVSRYHAVFSASPSSVVLCDLGSTNGTFVDGQRIDTPVALNPGQKVKIGETIITVNLSPDNLKDSQVKIERTHVGGMKKEKVTMLVADICNYSGMSHTLPSDDVAESLSAWLEIVSESVKTHHGQVDKYIGDCVMAFWQDREKEPEFVAAQAVRAALDIRRVTEEFSTSDHWVHNQSHPWRCRVSLNTGVTLMGSVGGGGARDFTVLGNTVNVTFHLNHVGKESGHDIVLSASTADLIRDSFVLEELGVVNVKGYGQLLAYGLLS
ncbi:adenylate/guanylate cyclase domain-containing protein [Oligoflexia bacterium]|nr:adenylate/guanylate cyclase domain-containing protein [Oligoflexia bacterium]